MSIERTKRKESFFGKLVSVEDKTNVAAVNRTRGSCMASTNFTTKPLRQMIGQDLIEDRYILMSARSRPTARK
jgi:hypothetical protein